MAMKFRTQHIHLATYFFLDAVLIISAFQYLILGNNIQSSYSSIIHYLCMVWYNYYISRADAFLELVKTIFEKRGIRVGTGQERGGFMRGTSISD